MSHGIHLLIQSRVALGNGSIVVGPFHDQTAAHECGRRVGNCILTLDVERRRVAAANGEHEPEELDYEYRVGNGEFLPTLDVTRPRAIVEHLGSRCIGELVEM